MSAAVALRARPHRRLAVGVAVFFSVWGAALPPVSGQARFVDVTEQTGIQFRHTDGGSGKMYIVEYISAGLALFDYDGDGDQDIYFLNGKALPGTRAATPFENALYRNDGGFRFTDVTAAAGVGDRGHGLGVAAADYDGDGDLDLYVNNYGPNVLYRNDGDGTFTDVTKAAGVANGDRVGAGVCFLDIEGDGDLDLYVANYVKFTFDGHVVRRRMGYPVPPSPRDYPPDTDTLYRNDGSGKFTDITANSGISGAAGPSMGMVCADYDDDGDTDVMVGNDVEANFLFENDGKGKFSESALVAGLAYDHSGMEHGSMGVECADYDGDGRLDFHVTSYEGETATLYRNFGDALYEDVTLATGGGLKTLRQVTWGNAIADFDNDGDRDLFIACGHLSVNVEKYDDTATYQAPNLFLENTGKGKFRNASASAGPGLAVRGSSRGLAIDDLDGDGDLDVVVLNSRAGPTVLRNDTPPGSHWLRLRLRGTKTNPNGVGARVTVVAGDLTLVDEVHSGRGYQSHYGLVLHFGLGKRAAVDRVEVRWIGGGTDVVKDVPVDRVVTIVEGGRVE